MLETCAEGRLAHQDCSALWPPGQTCGVGTGEPPVPPGAYACGPFAASCSLADDETCLDGVITFCALTAPQTVDCRAFGYVGCAAATVGSRQVAHCSP